MLRRSAGFAITVSLAALGCPSSHDRSDATPRAEAAGGGTSLAHSPPPAAREATPPTSGPTARLDASKNPRKAADLNRPTELGPIDPELRRRPVVEQQQYLLRLLRAFERLSPKADAELTRIITGSELLSFGNPEVSEPALSQAECQAKWENELPAQPDPSCGHRNMARASNQLCVDQYEFPNLLCEYPLVWVRASEADSICRALGKRLCDAHEWEGACSGEILTPDAEYAYAKLPKGAGAEYRRNRRVLMEGWHNQARSITWAYGPEKNHALCGTSSKKSPACQAVTYGQCGTNDFPAGSFPSCHSVSGIYDQHGNVAEHMSFPLFPDELGAKGYTEMKGSWFVFGVEETHPDDCRWRAKNWHTSRIADANSHRNYHLGFRCCADTSLP